MEPFAGHLGEVSLVPRGKRGACADTHILGLSPLPDKAMTDVQRAAAARPLGSEPVERDDYDALEFWAEATERARANGWRRRVRVSDDDRVPLDPDGRVVALEDVRAIARRIVAGEITNDEAVEMVRVIAGPPS